VIVENENECAQRDGRAATFSTFEVVQKKTYHICEKPGRWNDTPYWAMQMPATVVPDHSHIFNANFVALLESFFKQTMMMPAERSTLRPRSEKR
jgi:hypothetical protein